REIHYLRELPELENRNRYGGYELSPSYEVTGNFTVRKVGSKWWLVDPSGDLFWMNGVVRVTPSSALTPLDDRASYFESLPSAGSALDTFYRTQDDFLEPYYDARGVER